MFAVGGTGNWACNTFAARCLFSSAVTGDVSIRTAHIVRAVHRRRLDLLELPDGRGRNDRKKQAWFRIDGS